MKESNEEDEETESEESESDDENAKNSVKTAFFLRPYLTFTLSESSKEKFIKQSKIIFLEIVNKKSPKAIENAPNNITNLGPK